MPPSPKAASSPFSARTWDPRAGQSASYPLGTGFQGVSINVTQGSVTTQAYPIYVSANQVNAVMPSSVTPGLATLRVFYNSVKSNATTIRIAGSSPGIFAVSAGGFGPGIIQNFISATSVPTNSSVVPAAPGQTVIIWGTGLGPVSYPDNVVPTAGNVSTAVTVTVGGQPATVLYSGRSSQFAGVDQINVTLPNNVPLGCWVPVTVNAGGVVSNTATMAIAAAGAASCSDPGNPLSTLVRTPGTQALIHLERTDLIDNIDALPAATQILDKLYTRFYTRTASPYNFDPYMSLPPAGSCLVHQSSGDSAITHNLRGAVPASASLNQQPTQTYNTGTQPLTFSPTGTDYSTALGGTIGGVANGMNLLGAGGIYTIDPSGPNKTAIPFKSEPPPGWTRPSGIAVVPRTAPLALSFTPADTASPTEVMVYSYAAATNSTVEIACLAAAGATSFTISPDTLSNLAPSYQLADGSYTTLFIGTLGLNNAAPFTNGLAANGILFHSSWQAQSVAIQ